jgi:glycosyltransferase involved in cell wall biosynthesis
MSKGNVVYIGFSGFPFGLAAVSRQKLVAKGLIHAGMNVTVLCAKSVHDHSIGLPQRGEYEGIRYCYAVSPHRDKNFLIRNVKRRLSWFFELRELVRLNKEEKVTHVIVSNTNVFSYAVWIKLVSLVLRFKSILSLVEIYKSRPGQAFLTRVNNYLFNQFGLYFFDGYMPISHQLEEHFKAFPTPSFYYPVIVDMEKLKNKLLFNGRSTHFVFCGAAGYPKSIEFLIRSFEKMHQQDSHLTLVAGGGKEEVRLILHMIEQSTRKDDIQHLMNLSEEELYSLYTEADALLLPLFNTVQDQARFPHKLGEYLASGNPVITNEVGDLRYYLKDQVSALVLEPGNEMRYAQAMDFVVSHPSEAKQMGLQGKEICRENFEFAKLGEQCANFLQQIG